jgi:type I restriction enzyme S subunit
MKSFITEHIHLWTSAQAQKTSNRGISASNQQLLGIQKLRELILELAIRGKLVPQDPNDEPASELLKKIEAEKKRLIKEGNIKKQAVLSDVEENDQLFQLPSTWEWVKIGNIGYTQTGGTPSKNDNSLFGNDIPFIKPGDIYPNYVDYTNEGLSFKGVDSLGRAAIEGSILMVCIGTIGKCNLIDRTCAFNQQINSISPYHKISDFLLLTLRSRYFQDTAWGRSSSTTIAILNKGKWESIGIPLPPLSEQHRIVAKVDELMALCDELEKEQTNSNTAHETLVELLLSTLTDAKNSDDFKEAWQRVADCFDTLFTTEHSIDKLKQTILQLAVMGKLVPQDPNNEPASELLKKIAAEKARLVKEGKIKIEKNLPPITDEELHYQLPNNWIWCRMQDLCPNISSGSTPENRFFIDSGIPYLKVYNIRNQKIDFSFKEQFVSQDINSTKLKRSILNPGDVIMNIVGPPLGKVAIIPNDYDEWNCNQAIVFFKPVIREFNQWLYTFLCTGTFLNDIELIGTAGQDNISVTKSKNIVIPLPPLSEQLRIVSKVDELFALCDSLKERIREAQEIQNIFAEEIVRRVVS